jgi:hypothetical protein
MSRFRDLRPGSFGFLANVVLLVTGGGVTAGSAVSSPSVFFVKEVVVIVKTVGGQEFGVAGRPHASRSSFSRQISF